MHSVNEWINFSLPTFILTFYAPRLRELHVDSYSRTLSLSLLSYWSYSFSIINFLSLQHIQHMSLFLMATSPQISPILQKIIKIQCKKTCLVVFSFLSKLPKSVNHIHHTHLFTSHSFSSPMQSDITLYHPLKLFSLRGPEISNEQIQGIFFSIFMLPVPPVKSDTLHPWFLWQY